MEQNVPQIVFQFTDLRTAQDAADTFAELGYEPSLQDDAQPIVAIRVINEDLTSALEIGQAYGGKLLENRRIPSEEKAFAMAYDLEAGSLDGRNESLNPGDRPDAAGPEPEIPDSDEGPLYDVSAETYDHFSGDVRA